MAETATPPGRAAPPSAAQRLSPTRLVQWTRRWRPCLHLVVSRGAPLTSVVDHRHRPHEGVTSLGIGYGTFILDHPPVRGFLDAEVQWTRNPSDATVRRWSPSTAWKKLASKRLEC